jgi:hypothetical protein
MLIVSHIYFEWELRMQWNQRRNNIPLYPTGKSVILHVLCLPVNMELKATSVSGFSVRKRISLLSCRNSLLSDLGRMRSLRRGVRESHVKPRVWEYCIRFVISQVTHHEHMRSCLVRYLLWLIAGTHRHWVQQVFQNQKKREGRRERREVSGIRKPHVN